MIELKEDHIDKADMLSEGNANDNVNNNSSNRWGSFSFMKNMIAELNSDVASTRDGELTPHLNEEELKKDGPHIGLLNEVPAYQRLINNMDIKSGYRINYNTWALTLKSLVHCHNESVNIWTHLIGALACIGSIVMLFTSYKYESPAL